MLIFNITKKGEVMKLKEVIEKHAVIEKVVRRGLIVTVNGNDSYEFTNEKVSKAFAQKLRWFIRG